MVLRWPVMMVGMLALASAACAGEGTRAKTGIAPPARIPDPAEATLEPKGQPVAIAAVPREIRRAVVADAARRQGVAENAIVVTRAEQVTWADGSLGCPEPGRSYVQVLVEGYRLIAKSPQGERVYHSDSRGNVVSCATRPPSPHLREGKTPDAATPATAPPPAPDR